MKVKQNYLTYVVLTSAFLFPVLIATVKKGGSTYALILLLGLVLGWGVWRSLESWEKKVLVGFAVLFLLISLSLVNTEDYSSGVKRLGRYVHFPLFIPMYLLIKKYQIEVGKVFLLGIVVSTVVMFGQSMYQVVILEMDRAIGSTNAIILGDTAMMFAVIIGCSLLTVANKWQHYALGVLAIGLALSACVMTIAKGAWILLPVIIVWLLWLKRKSIGKSVFALIVFVSVLSIAGLFSIDKVKNRFDVALNEYNVYLEDPTLNNTNSIGPRIEMWRDSITIWVSNPVLGTGIGDYGNDRLQLYKDGQSNLKVKYGHAHSIYFELLSTTGLVGFFGLLIFIQIIPFKLFYSFWIEEHDVWIKFYALSGMATIIAFAVFGMTEAWIVRNSFVRIYLMCILVFMSSIAVIKGREKKL